MCAEALLQVTAETELNGGGERVRVCRQISQLLQDLRMYIACHRTDTLELQTASTDTFHKMLKALIKLRDNKSKTRWTGMYSALRMI